MPETSEDQSWLGIIARALAFLCLRQADLPDKNLATQANFLQRFGLPLREAAHLLGTTEASLRELIRQASKAKPGKHALKKKS
jgi:hypothetical protein